VIVIGEEIEAQLGAWMRQQDVAPSSTAVVRFGAAGVSRSPRLCDAASEAAHYAERQVQGIAQRQRGPRPLSGWQMSGGNIGGGPHARRTRARH